MVEVWGGNVAMLELQSSDTSTLRRDRMKTDSQLPESPKIGQTTGRRSHSLVLSVDGLCIAIVDRPEMLQAVAADLESVMSERQSPSGSLLLGPRERTALPMAYRKELANLGISVKRSNTPNLVVAAQGILNDFWRRQRAIQTRYEAAQHRG